MSLDPVDPSSPSDDATRAVECPSRPEFALLPRDTLEKLRFVAAGEGGALQAREPLHALDLWRLRNLEPDNAAWQRFVDAFTEAAGDSRSRDQARYPTTQWGMLLAGLPSGEAEAWMRFMEAYRRPIARSIRLLCRNRESGVIAGASDDELASQFFSWFAANNVQDRLARVDDTGTVRRFRGYLKACIRTFIRYELMRDAATPPLESQLHEPGYDTDESAQYFGHTVDLEYCRHAVSQELAVMRRDQPSVWNALRRALEGENPATIAAQLATGGDGDAAAPSRATAYRMAQRARKALRTRLIQYRLHSATLNAAEAEAEFVELLPLLAVAIREAFDQTRDVEPLDD